MSFGLSTYIDLDNHGAQKALGLDLLVSVTTRKTTTTKTTKTMR